MKDKQMAGAGFGGPLLLSFTLIMTFITVGVKVSCLLRFTLAASSVAHKSPFGDSGLILCWSRIRKFVTYREYTDRQTEKAIREATPIPWIAGLSGPIHEKIRISYLYYYNCYYYYYY